MYIRYLCVGALQHPPLAIKMENTDICESDSDYRIFPSHESNKLILYFY